MDWSSHYPAYVSDTAAKEDGKPHPLSKDIEIVDIGCGFGGLLVALSPILPETLMLGKNIIPIKSFMPLADS